MTRVVALALVVAFAGPAQADEPPPGKIVFLMHGGAGAPKRETLTPEKEKLYVGDFEQALRAGYDLIKQGRPAIDAVEAGIIILEDSPRFNAGRGAVMTRDGTFELDASIMEGTTRKAGAVAGISRIKNPIKAARTIMDKSEHVMMIGPGAERFVASHGLEEVSPMYFWTEERFRELQSKKKFGTVGAVALDKQGHLAAGTSTGGMTYKRPGRLGDSPVISAGTYCDDRACGVSCTGHGELFIRVGVAHDIVARMRYAGLSVKDAAAATFAELPREEGGVGGLIALDKDGNATMPFDTGAMFRGWVTAAGEIGVRIYEK